MMILIALLSIIVFFWFRFKRLENRMLLLEEKMIYQQQIEKVKAHLVQGKI
jgi:hypothetical protein